MSECRAEYERKGGRQPGDRIIRCHLDAGHYPQSCHEEEDTGVRWWDIPPSPELRRRTPDEQLTYWAGKSVEWIAEKHALTARAERAEAAEADLRATVERVRHEANCWSFLDDESATVDELRDRILAALDSTTPPPSPGGEGARTLRADLADEADRIDKRGGMISAAWVADGMRHLAQYGHRRPRAGELTHIHNAPAALDGGQPDTPAPTEAS